MEINDCDNCTRKYTQEQYDNALCNEKSVVSYKLIDSLYDIMPPAVFWALEKLECELKAQGIERHKNIRGK